MFFRKTPEKKKYPSEIDNLRTNNTFLRLMNFVMVVVAMVCAMGWYKSLGSERIILVPPENHKTVWVDTENVSNEYLEEMADYIASLELDVTPETAKYQSERLLKYVAPEERGALKVKMEDSIAKIVAYSASTVFHPSSVTFGSGKDAMKVVLSGSKSTFIADKRVSEELKTYLIVFTYRNSKIYLKNFKEVDPKDPFNEDSKANDSGVLDVPRQ